MTQLEPQSDDKWAEPRGVHDANDPVDVRCAPLKRVHPIKRRVFPILLLLAAVLLVALLYPQPSSAPMPSLSSIRSSVTMVVVGGIERFRSDMGCYPDPRDGGLKALAVRPRVHPERWAGPYVTTEELKDPGGHELRYRCPGQHNPDGYDLWSVGPDGVDGTKDDIGNWEQ